MTKKIFNACFAVALTVLAAALIIIFGILYDYFSALQDKQLDGELALAVQGVELSGESYIESLGDTDCRMTLIDRDGSVICDTRMDAGGMENHSDRKEFRDAVSIGIGRDSRYSSTLMEKTTYLARRLSDGTVLRASVTRYSFLPILLGMAQPMIAVILLAIILAFLLARRMARKIAGPLNSINLDDPLSNDTYDEIAPLLGHIERQNRQIGVQLEKLRSDKEELTAITDNLNEGLILLDSRNTVLSINPAAKRIFGVSGSECKGKSFLVIDRSVDMAKLIDECVKNGKSELCTERSGRVYSLSAGRISGGAAAKVVVLVFDISEMVFAEKNRREFTANVSHELKTPLQSIMGSAELMQNGLVKPEDMPVFIGRIRTESQRLLDLIEDILRLSHLDEAEEIPLETVDLYAVAAEAASELKENADKRNITVSLSGGETKIHAVNRLVYEIVYNLIDNSVKYNNDGGRIDISVEKRGDKAVFEIADTGIGIPAEAQSHIFERFYRVDKSRSRAIGGTGLGLAIVKHAANYLGAVIRLDSEPNRGTKITVEFK